jgi:hypothetical protein
MTTKDNEQSDAATLRERAALARRLALGLPHDDDRRRLTEVADEFEADAAKLDKGSE